MKNYKVILDVIVTQRGFLGGWEMIKHQKITFMLSNTSFKLFKNWSILSFYFTQDHNLYSKGVILLICHESSHVSTESRVYWQEYIIFVTFLTSTALFPEQYSYWNNCHLLNIWPPFSTSFGGFLEVAVPLCVCIA